MPNWFCTKSDLQSEEDGVIFCTRWVSPLSSHIKLSWSFLSISKYLAIECWTEYWWKKLSQWNFWMEGSVSLNGWQNKFVQGITYSQSKVFCSRLVKLKSSCCCHSVLHCPRGNILLSSREALPFSHFPFSVLPFAHSPSLVCQLKRGKMQMMLCWTPHHWRKFSVSFSINSWPPSLDISTGNTKYNKQGL